MLRQNFIVSDGLDGSGKSFVLRGSFKYFEELGLRIFDIHEFWKKYDNHPEFENKKSPLYVNPDSFDVYFTSEPTFVGIGKAVRFEMIAKNGRNYSARFTANGYAMDREILFKRIHIPLQDLGKIGVQSRSFSTSITYQPLQSTVQEENPLTIEDIMGLSGNKLAYDNVQGLLMIPTIVNVDDVIQRLANRKKNDNCNFEKLEFQLKLKPLYEGDVLRSIFEAKGTKVKYLEADVSEEHSIQQGYEVTKNYFENLKK